MVVTLWCSKDLLVEASAAGGLQGLHAAALAAFCYLESLCSALSRDAGAWEGACTQPQREKLTPEEEYSYESDVYSNERVAI